MDGSESNLLVEPGVPAGLFNSRPAFSRGAFAPAGPARALRSASRLSRYFFPAVAAFVACVFALASVAAVAAPTDENQVIVPGGTAAKPAAPAPGPAGTGPFTIVAIVFLAGAGAWLVWRGRRGQLAGVNRTARHLAIEETRSLGNRQFLVVATYQEKKFLLGVCPGRIDLLAPLHEGAAPVPAKERT